MSSPKSSARQVALQALYQWQVTGQNLEELQKQFEGDPEYGKFHKNFFIGLLTGVVDKISDLDTVISEFTSRDLEKIDPIEKAVLRLGSYELLFKPEVPYRVAINESVKLAKRFGSSKSHTFVNSVLDKVAKKSRAVEMSANIKKAK